MASRDLQLVNDPPIILESSRSSNASTAGDDSPEASLVFDVIRKRWWLLGLCVLLSGPIAYFVADTIREADRPLSRQLDVHWIALAPGAELSTRRRPWQPIARFFSRRRICSGFATSMDWGCLPHDLAELFQCTLKQGSSIMELSLRWADAEDGIALVNDTMQLLIDEAARQRKEILKEHMKHVESAQLAAKSDVDHALEQLRVARRQRDERLSAGRPNRRPIYVRAGAGYQHASCDSMRCTSINLVSSSESRGLTRGARRLLNFYVETHVDVRMSLDPSSL